MAFDRDGLLVARITTTIVHKGRRYPIRKGVTVVYSDDSVVQGRERLFEPLKVTRLGGRRGSASPAATETATAGPGELRGPVLPPGPDERRDVEVPTPAAPVERFAPAEHTVAQVNAYLADVDLAERERVLQDEAVAQGRRGILAGPYSDLTGA